MIWFLILWCIFSIPLGIALGMIIQSGDEHGRVDRG